MTDVLVFGGTMVDYLIKPKAETFVPGTCVLAAQERIIGGVGLNMARNLKRLGADVIMACVVGADENGRDIVSYLHQLQIRPGLVLNVAEQPTATFIGLHNKDGNVAMAAAIKGIYSHVQSNMLEDEQFVFLAYDTWVLDSSFNSDIYHFLSSIAEEKSIYLTICGADECERVMPILSKLKALFCNYEEIKALAKVLGRDGEDIHESLNYVAQSGAKMIFATDGANGVYVYYKDEIIHYPAPEARVICVNGAGDAFASATIYALENGLSLHEAVQKGQAAAKRQIEGNNNDSSYDSVDEKLVRRPSLAPRE